MFGIVAKFTDWSQTGYACHGAPDEESAKYVLPLILKYLTPPAVSWIGEEIERDFRESFIGPSKLPLNLQHFVAYPN